MNHTTIADQVAVLRTINARQEKVRAALTVAQAEVGKVRKRRRELSKQYQQAMTEEAGWVDQVDKIVHDLNQLLCEELDIHDDLERQQRQAGLPVSLT